MPSLHRTSLPSLQGTPVPLLWRLLCSLSGIPVPSLWGPSLWEPLPSLRGLASFRRSGDFLLMVAVGVLSLSVTAGATHSALQLPGRRFVLEPKLPSRGTWRVQI